MTVVNAEVGALVRDWRQRRRLSQLGLSTALGMSARHLSFVETGRSRPSPGLILRLGEELDVPLAERNTMLLAAGYAPAYSEQGLDAIELEPLRAAARRLIEAHAPYPALLVERHWNLVEANAAVSVLTAQSAPHLLTEPINVLRLSLHPEGMAPRVVNLAEWRQHVLVRLARQAQITADPVLAELYEELCALPEGEHDPSAAGLGPSIVVPLRYRHGEHTLNLLSTTTVFGQPRDVTVAGLAVEAFFPADAATAERLREIANE